VIRNWALRHPLRAAAFIGWRAGRRIQKRKMRARDQTQCSFSLQAGSSLAQPLVPPGLDAQKDAALWSRLAKFYHAHQFDVLGSGWSHVSLPLAADRQGNWLKERVNQANFEESAKIWSLTSNRYLPIDWQCDFKSGFRWSEKEWFSEIKISPTPGADIKVPWELSRAHHLPHLALAYGADGRADHVREFRDQVLDFMAQNPPRFGANWNCAMDVAIRAANWIVAYDLFIQSGAVFDPIFNRLLARSLFEHGLFLEQNLEWHPVVRGNHYLANIAGLIFIAARLEESDEAKRWLDFAAGELARETLRQFLPDGANFESSTSYHRLSAEMVAFSVAVLRGPAQHRIKDKENFAPLFERLEKMAEFSMHLTKSNGRITQVGDNDSGRFLKLDVCFHNSESGPIEDFLDHRPLVSMLNGFFQRPDLDAFAGAKSLSRQWLNQNFTTRPITASRPKQSGAAAVTVEKASWAELEGLYNSVAQICKREFTIPWAVGTGMADAAHYAYPHFGAYIFASSTFTVIMRCGSRRWDISGGHAHNDQLSCEVEIAGEDRIRDPGSLLYTPSPELRNLYRSTRAHFTPALEGREQADLNQGLFFLPDQTHAECVHFKDYRFAGLHRAYGQPVYRLVEVSATGIWIRDFHLGPEPLIWPAEPLPFSDGYGRREA